MNHKIYNYQAKTNLHKLLLICVMAFFFLFKPVAPEYCNWQQPIIDIERWKLLEENIETKDKLE